MTYRDGLDIEPGDIMLIARNYRGKVIASMDRGRYLYGHKGWAYLGEGIMVDTDFGGLVHYTVDSAEDFELIERS